MSGFGEKFCGWTFVNLEQFLVRIIVQINRRLRSNLVILFSNIVFGIWWFNLERLGQRATWYISCYVFATSLVEVKRGWELILWIFARIYQGHLPICIQNVQRFCYLHLSWLSQIFLVETAFESVLERTFCQFLWIFKVKTLLHLVKVDGCFWQASSFLQKLSSSSVALFIILTFNFLHCVVDAIVIIFVNCGAGIWNEISVQMSLASLASIKSLPQISPPSLQEPILVEWGSCWTCRSEQILICDHYKIRLCSFLCRHDFRIVCFLTRFAGLGSWSHRGQPFFCVFSSNVNFCKILLGF